MIRYALLSVLILPALLPAAGIAAELPRCESPFSDPPGTSRYWVYREPICRTHNAKALFPSAVAPAPVLVDCTRNGSLHTCQAWPQGEDLTYDWYVTGNGQLTTPVPTADPTAQIMCTDNQVGSSGSYTVTVTSPYGVSASRFGFFGCGAHTIEY